MLAEGEFTEAEYNKLKRKVDFILLPLVCPVLLALASPRIAELLLTGDPDVVVLRHPTGEPG
jgi:hypothetical protein